MNLQAVIPMPLQIVIDDVGWRTGRDGHEDNEPYRTGIARDHGPDDYRAIVELGRQLGMAPQAAMILGEWDAKNLLRRVPSASWMGERWDNSLRAGAWIEESAQVIRESREHFEVTLHGIGHEYWDEQGVMSRAEWHDRCGQPRPVDTIRAKLELFFELHDQHRLGPPPRSFVPCAFLHHFGREGADNLAGILGEYGITSVSTPFRWMHRTPQPQGGDFGFDHGVITLDRGRDPFGWNVIGPMPKDEPRWPILGMHWPNLLHEDPARNQEVVERWFSLLEPWGRRIGNMLAPDTERFCAQWIYHAMARLTLDGQGIIVDASACHRLSWAELPDHPLTLKLGGVPAQTVWYDGDGKLPARREVGPDGPLQVLQIHFSATKPVAHVRPQPG